MPTCLPPIAFNAWLIFTVGLITVNLATYIWLIKEKQKNDKWEIKHTALEQKLGQHAKYYDDMIDVLLQKNPLLSKEIKEMLVEHYKQKGKVLK